MPLVPVVEDLLQHRRAVGHDPVDAEVEQADHLARVVDGPHVHVHAPAGGPRRPASAVTTGGVAVGGGSWAQGAGRLVDLLGRRRRPARAASEPAGPERRADAGQGGPDPGDALVGERADADPVDGVGAAQDLDQRLDGGVVLGVDVDPQVGPGAEQVLEQRDGLDAVDPGLAAPPTTGSSAMAPVRSVTRSSTSSWNASSTPSAVTCTSVST